MQYKENNKKINQTTCLSIVLGRVEERNELYDASTESEHRIRRPADLTT